jgi:hypothetical protein
MLAPLPRIRHAVERAGDSREGARHVDCGSDLGRAERVPTQVQNLGSR